jgi:hypothetical protein
LKDKAQPRSIVVVGDLHAGCRMGLHPDRPVTLQGGMESHASPLQSKVWSHWRHFHDVFVPGVTKGEPHILVVNGDALDGRHHGSTTQISQNLADQQTIAEGCLRLEVEKAHTYYHIAGTEAHVGPSAEDEERLAKALGAKPDTEGQHARPFLWLDLLGHLIHVAHHVGGTSARAYEMTAPHREYVEFCADAGQWGRPAPQLIVRSHRHRYCKPTGAGLNGESGCVVVPGFQLKTPFVHRLMGGRASEPQIGGVVIRVGGRLGLYVAAYVYQMDRPQVEVFGG